MTTYDPNESVSRRAFVGAVAGGSALGAAGTAAAQEEDGDGTTTEGGGGTTTDGGDGTTTEGGTATEGGGGTTTDGGDGTTTEGGTADGTTTGGGEGGGGGSEEVVVGPGGELVYEPADLTVAPGTTVNFVWESDNHNVVPDSIPDDAQWEGTPGAPEETYDTGNDYSHTFDVEGTYDYFCQPHVGAGMEATISVSADAGGGGASRPTLPNSALTIGVATVGVMVSTLALAFFFLKYGGDYESLD